MTSTTNLGGRPESNGIGASRSPTVENLVEPRRRGRPRSSGGRHCDRCGRDVAKIRVRWPDGSICGACFTSAVHEYGLCSTCGDQRLLPGRSPAGEHICRDCAGITTALVCDRCGREAERFRKGVCARCAVREDLESLLQPNSPPDLRLKRLVGILTDAGRPESIYTWMNKLAPKQLLTLIGEREVPLTHEGFDSYSPSPSAAAHLREILVHHRILPERRSLPFALFESWLEQRLIELAEWPDIHSPVERFARWHHLKNLRLKLDAGAPNIDTATRSAKQEITEAGKFLRWLLEEHGTVADGLQQAHVDEYLSEGTSTRKHIRNFVHWLRPGRPRKRTVTAPHRAAKSMPMLTQSQRIELVRNCLDFEQVTLSTRVAALIFLLWAHPLVKIAALTVEQVEMPPSGMTIKLGVNPAAVPALVAPLFWQHLSSRGNQQTANTGTAWLFPGFRAGQHIHHHTLGQRFQVFGIDPQRARNTTLQDLSREVDARSLIDLLGYSGTIIVQHAARAGVPMSDYIDLRRSPTQR
jgi:hypothetical protein